LDLDPGERVSLSADSHGITEDLVDAIFGLETIDSGVIEIDGHDIRDLALPALRSRVALVRDAELFPGCILDNLRAANHGLSPEDAWTVLDGVGLRDVVKALPLGLQTPLLADGTPLTRPQATALTVARALAADPSLLILDRTLDHLDPVEGLQLLDRVGARHRHSLLVVSDDPEVHRRTDRHLHIAEDSPRHTEAA
jgi:ABC-type multidrug transport system fused ATPase/permease subunit